MYFPEEELTDILRNSGVDFLTTLPCDRVKNLIALTDRDFQRLSMTREEEGVGICAGAALAGRKPAMIIQSSGVGNLLNALLSLTGFYELPLALFISQRGVYKEGIAAQVPMGAVLPQLFDALGINYTVVDERGKFALIFETLRRVYGENRIHAFLLSPALWEGSELVVDHGTERGQCDLVQLAGRKAAVPQFTRYEILRRIRSVLEGKAVICNLGVPSKELHELVPQPSNFYMLGSMGMATPIGLGVALSTSKDVFVIDGDGSILMNPGTLATVAVAQPANLTVVAIDNASYGSTGGQPTLTNVCVDLEVVARGFGLQDTAKAASEEDLFAALRRLRKGPRFVHALALPGNANVPNIGLDGRKIKEDFQHALQS